MGLSPEILFCPVRTFEREDTAQQFGAVIDKLPAAQHIEHIPFGRKGCSGQLAPLQLQPGDIQLPAHKKEVVEHTGERLCQNKTQLSLRQTQAQLLPRLSERGVGRVLA